MAPFCQHTTCRAKGWEDRETGQKSNGIWPWLLDLRIHQWRKMFPVPQELSCSWLLLQMPLPPLSQENMEAKAWENEEKREKENPIVPPPLYLNFRSLCCIMSQKQSIFPQVLSKSQYLLEDSRVTEVRVRDTEVKLTTKKNPKTTHLVLWFQVFFLNILADIYLVEQLFIYSVWVL